MINTTDTKLAEVLRQIADYSLSQFLSLEDMVAQCVGDAAKAIAAFDAQKQETLYTAPQLQAAVAAEREACAKICESLSEDYGSEVSEVGDRSHGKSVAANSCAAAIRARGEGK